MAFSHYISSLIPVSCSILLTYFHSHKDSTKMKKKKEKWEKCAHVKNPIIRYFFKRINLESKHSGQLAMSFRLSHAPVKLSEWLACQSKGLAICCVYALFRSILIKGRSVWRLLLKPLLNYAKKNVQNSPGDGNNDDLKIRSLKFMRLNRWSHYLDDERSMVAENQARLMKNLLELVKPLTPVTKQ